MDVKLFFLFLSCTYTIKIGKKKCYPESSILLYFDTFQNFKIILVPSSSDKKQDGKNKEATKKREESRKIASSITEENILSVTKSRNFI